MLHLEEIRAAVVDPMSPESLEFWGKADKPFLFMAWSREWIRYVEAPDALIYFRIQRDGSNNGVQHHAALSRDVRAAGTVNLMAADTPQDVYGDVAKELNAALAVEATTGEEVEDREMAKAWLKYGITRTDTKRSVMTMPYGSSQHSRTAFVHDEVKARIQKGYEVPFENSMKACAWLSRRLTKAMEGSLTGPMANMAWMKQVATEHGGFLAWTTPDGLPVQQHYAVSTSHQVVCHIGGSKVHLRTATPTKQADVSRQKAGIAPNFIHSLDACHMRMYILAALAEGIRDFSMIHDSYGCHPNDGDTMQRLIREEFVSLYNGNDIPRLLHHLAPGIPPLPMGTLDLEQVLHAEYFFA
jgi:DNA-directed RNA polymerase